MGESIMRVTLPIPLAPCHPVRRRPTHRGTGLAQGAKVESPTGRTTLGSQGHPACPDPAAARGAAPHAHQGLRRLFRGLHGGPLSESVYDRWWKLTRMQAHLGPNRLSSGLPSVRPSPRRRVPVAQRGGCRLPRSLAGLATAWPSCCGCTPTALMAARMASTIGSAGRSDDSGTRHREVHLLAGQQRSASA